MATDDMSGKVQTVLGPISPEQLGVTHTHDHLLMDTSGLYPVPSTASERGLYYAKVTPETVGELRHYGDSGANLDDMRIIDVSEAIEETLLFRQHGGNTIVDVTSLGIGRDPVGLARISRATGVNVIMGSSYYIPLCHPPDMDSRSEDDIVQQIVGDLTEGVGGTGIKSGIIGEVGCVWPLTGNGLKVLRASGRTQRLTGAPISVHPGRDVKAPFDIVDVLSQVGADMAHTIIGHIERTLFDLGDLRRLAETGCYIQWDLMGEERSFYPYNVNVGMPNDGTRLDQIAWLSSEGYGDRILVSHDIGFKRRRVKYGGHGYGYILSHIVPRMRSRDFSEEAIHKILVDNPRAVLTFSELMGS